jgi:hypothetical protein
MKEGPWTSGPQELLNHARDHLDKGTDVDHRFAMISVDNAVELMLRTYLTLPKRVTGIRLTANQREEATRYFPTALAAVESLAAKRLSAVPLGEVEWFHGIRNTLYHEGNAITVQRDKVLQYLQHAEALMEALFGPGQPPRPPKVNRQSFLASLDQDGRPFFRSLLDYAESLYLPIHWGVKGFSVNVDLAGTHVAILYGYPPRSAYGQSVYTGMVDISRKVSDPQPIVGAYREGLRRLRVFHSTPAEMKWLIRGHVEEDTTNRLLALLSSVIDKIRESGPQE